MHATTVVHYCYIEQVACNRVVYNCHDLGTKLGKILSCSLKPSCIYLSCKQFLRFDCGKYTQRDLFCPGNIGLANRVHLFLLLPSLFQVSCCLVNVDVFCVSTVSTLKVVIFHTIKLDS